MYTNAGLMSSKPRITRIRWYGKNRLANGGHLHYRMDMPSTAYRYITKRPGVRGGNAIIEGTRIGVHDVVGFLQTGETVDSICSPSCLPGITKSQVYECLAYYEDHRGEIDVLVARQMAGPEA